MPPRGNTYTHFTYSVVVFHFRECKYMKTNQFFFIFIIKKIIYELDL